MPFRAWARIYIQTAVHQLTGVQPEACWLFPCLNMKRMRCLSYGSSNVEWTAWGTPAHYIFYFERCICFWRFFFLLFSWLDHLIQGISSGCLGSFRKRLYLKITISTSLPSVKYQLFKLGISLQMKQMRRCVCCLVRFRCASSWSFL